MKKLFFLFAMFALTGMVISCGSDDDDDDSSKEQNRAVYDIGPVEFKIAITDGEGHDLLDSTYSNNVVNYITVQYNDETYLPSRERYAGVNGSRQTRAYAPTFNGLVLRKKTNFEQKYVKSDYLLVFGEFNGMENIEKRSIRLSVADSCQVSLSYSNEFRWNSDGSPDIKLRFFVDNQEVKDIIQGIYQFQLVEGKGLVYNP